MKIIPKQQFDLIVDSIVEQRTSSENYDMWLKYHNDVYKVLHKYETGSYPEKNVSYYETDYLYHPGDWFHEENEAVVILNHKILNIELLEDLQKVLKNHHENSNLYITLEEELFDDLTVMITPKEVYISYENCTENKAHRILSKLLKKQRTKKLFKYLFNSNKKDI